MNISGKIKKLQLFLGMNGVDAKITTYSSYDDEKKRVRNFYGLFVNGNKIGYTSKQISILEVLVMMMKDIRRIGGDG